MVVVCTRFPPQPDGNIFTGEEELVDRDLKIDGPSREHVATIKGRFKAFYLSSLYLC